MDIQQIPVSDIDVVARQREIDPVHVAEIMDSISQQDLFQPIGVQPYQQGIGTRYKLVWGAHRLEAFKCLSRDLVPAKVIADEASESYCQMLEIQENLARSDLTNAQRKAFAAKVLILKQQLKESGEIGDDQVAVLHIGDKMERNWIATASKEMNVPERTMRNWWADYNKGRNRYMRAADAKKSDYEDFLIYLKQKEEEEKVAIEEKQRRKEEEKLKAEEAKRQRMIIEQRHEVFDLLNDSVIFLVENLNITKQEAFEMVNQWQKTWEKEYNC
jgi:hypothetical protein